MATLYKDRYDFKFLDFLQLWCEFSDKLELAANEPSYEFMQRRMDFLDEEVEELRAALYSDDKDGVEILDGAIDVAFVALTQAYHIFRVRGMKHTDAIHKVRAACMEVGRSNLMKDIPTQHDAKITKPEGWVAPDEFLGDLFLSGEEILKRRKAEGKKSA